MLTQIKEVYYFIILFTITRERERDRQRETHTHTQRERDRDRERERVCVSEKVGDNERKRCGESGKEKLECVCIIDI